MSNYFITKDRNLARKAAGGNYLQGNQACVVKIVKAFYTENAKGTQTLNLALENAKGEKGDIRLHFANSEGELPDYNKMMALLDLTEIEGISRVSGVYEAYDFERGQRVEKKGFVAPELTSKFVGMVFSYNYYQNPNGEVKYNIDLHTLYHYKTHQFIDQFQDGTPIKEGQIELAVEKAVKASQKSEEKAKGISYQPQSFQAPPKASPVNQKADVQDEEMPF